MVTKFEQMRASELSNFFKQINPIIQQYMENNSIDILLEQKNVFIAKNNSDITNKIIEEINKSFNQ